MRTAEIAKRRLRAIIHEDRVLRPLIDLSGLARSILRRVAADFPGVFDTRRDRRAGDKP